MYKGRLRAEIQMLSFFLSLKFICFPFLPVERAGNRLGRRQDEVPARGGAARVRATELEDGAESRGKSGGGAERVRQDERGAADAAGTQCELSLIRKNGRKALSSIHAVVKRKADHC